MSTLKVTHLQNESNSEPSISISSAGLIGIGTASPRDPVHIFHPTNNVNLLIESGDANSYLAFRDNTTTSDSAVYLGAEGNNLKFITSAAERFRITSGGNVNIGGNFTETSHQLNISDSTKPSLCLHTGTTQRADFSATTGITSIRSFSNSPFTINIGGSGETEAFRISGDGDIGINKSSITSWGANIPTIEIKGRAETGSQAVRSGAIAFESGSGTNGYAILWGNAGGIEYYSSATNRATAAYGCKFTSSGNLAFASGKGIDFSATGQATGMANELLDDYEEGTWTPSLSNFTLGNGILTGQYTKIGNIVHITFRLDAGSTTTFTGSADGISGLPFSNALASNTGYLTASNPSNNWFGFTQQYSTGTASNYLQWVTSSSNHQVGSATQPFTWGSSTIMRFNMTYRAA